MGEDIGEPLRIPAGIFSIWVESEFVSADVPCGTCNACCRSSMFIHIEPEEVEAIERIPPEILFHAPWQSEGHLMMGFNEQGHCPMLVDNKCSIYDVRPQTCRDYDCRVFAATGVAVDLKRQPEIAKRVAQWVFEHDSAESQEEEARLKSAAAFLCQNRDLFPPDSIPYNPSEIALLAIGIYKAFPGDSQMTATEIARALSVEMDLIEDFA